MKQNKTARIARELRRIAQRNSGLLLPEIVVREARPASSPLHSRFEWDDGEAADNWRLWQARQLIRVVVEHIPGMAAPTEVFVSLSPDRRQGSGYRVTTEVLSDSELREIMLQDALDELDIFKLKYRRLRELSIVFQAMKRLPRKERASKGKTR